MYIVQYSSRYGRVIKNDAHWIFVMYMLQTTTVFHIAYAA